MVDVANLKELEAWLTTQPREVVSVIAARTAWRVWPLLDIRQRKNLSIRSLDGSYILPLSRSSASALLYCSFKTNEFGRNETAGVAAWIYQSIYDGVARSRYEKFNFTTHAFGPADSSVASSHIVSRKYTKTSEEFAGLAIRCIKSAASGASSASEDFSVIWDALQKDIDVIIGGIGEEKLVRYPLWMRIDPRWMSKVRAEFEKELLALNQGWEVWIDWYDGMIRGGPCFQDVAFINAINDLALWEGTPAEVNARIAKLVEEERSKLDLEQAEQSAVTNDQLLSIASPRAIINVAGKIDAAPNSATDKPIVDAELPTLPLRQLAIVKTILDSLGKNAPQSLRGALKSYAGELKIRGVQPILGLLSDMFAIVDADCKSRDADEWIVDGIREAFARFSANHATFIQHFPLSVEREAVLNRLEMNEAHAPGQAARDAMKNVVEAANNAVDAGIADANLAVVLSQHQEALDVVISTPPAHQEIAVGNADRIIEISPAVTTSFRTRVAASVAGFALSIIAIAKRGPLGLTANLLQVFESKSFEGLLKSAQELWAIIAPFIGLK